MAVEEKSRIILLSSRQIQVEAFADSKPHVVTSEAEIPNSFEHASKNSLWVSYSDVLTHALVKHAISAPSKLIGSALLLHYLSIKDLPILSLLFERVAFIADGFTLPHKELAEVLSSKNRNHLFVAGFVNKEIETITFWLGNMEHLTVPFSVFEKSGDGTEPNFDNVSLIDHGHTVKLGNYEAATAAIIDD